jgi:hypothetical protein
MTYPVHQTIAQGETLLLEFRFQGEDLSDATPRVEVSTGLADAEITAELDGLDTVIVRSIETDCFDVGRHTLELWLDWPPSALLRKELAIVVFVVV